MVVKRPVAAYSEDAGGAAAATESEEVETVEPSDDAATSSDPLPKKLR
jgi:hypothetical protein